MEPLEKALILLERSRYKLAEAELKRQLVIDPSNPLAHVLLSICLIELKHYKEALYEAKLAVKLAPDLSDTHYNLAKILYLKKQLKLAKVAVHKAIHLESVAEYFALLSAIELAQKNRTKALASAERGLSLDAKHLLCQNLRAMALLRLNRYQEAQSTIETAIAQDPENATAYTIQGWVYLHCGDADRAWQCFRESLRLNPEQEQARRGILESLKSKYLLYSLIFKYNILITQVNIYLRLAIVVIFALVGISNRFFLLVPLLTILLEVAKLLFNLLFRFDAQWRSLQIPIH